LLGKAKYFLTFDNIESTVKKLVGLGSRNRNFNSDIARLTENTNLPLTGISVINVKES
jgi:hypothetical protein